MKRHLLTILAILLVIGLALVGCSNTTPAPTTPAPAPPSSSAAPPIEMTMSTHQPATQFIAVVAQSFAKNVETASNGRLKFKFFGGGTLIAGDQAFVELKKGTADIAEVGSQLMPSNFPLNTLSQKLLYDVKDLATDYRIYYELKKQIPEFAKEWGDVHPLFSHDPGEQHLQSTKAVRSLADFKGLKVRTPGPWLKDTLTSLGSTVITVPPQDVYISLQKGIIDADMHPMEFLKSYKTAELEKYTTLISIFDAPASLYCMNWNSYNKLPKDLQKIVDDAAVQADKDMIAAVNRENAGGLDYARTLGSHEVFQLTPDELKKFFQLAEQEAIQAAKDADAKGLPGTKMYDLARQLIKNQ